MGIPVIILGNPITLSTFTDSICTFDATYTDSIDSFVASTFMFEVDITDTFDSINKKNSIFSSIVTASNKKVPFVLSNGTWYWRVTATNTSGTTISETRSFIVDAITQFSIPVLVNVGKLVIPTNVKSEYQYVNVSNVVEPTNQRSLYLYENIIEYVPPLIKRRYTQII